jgi:hypothetical protein
MKHRTNKTATVFIASIFILSGLTVAYSAWTDTLYIDGSVTTGIVCWRFSSATIEDDDQPINPGGDHPTDDPDLTCNPGFIEDPDKGFFWDLDKNVAWGEIVIKDLNGEFKKLLEVTLYNVYPCYFNEISFYAVNCGTIPIKFDHIIISDANEEYKLTADDKVTLDLSDNTIPDFEIWWNDDDFGDQLEPGERLQEQSLWLHVLQDEDPAFQAESFTFTISLVAVQWNEYPLPD